MSKAGKKIIAGLKEAIAVSKGEAAPARVHYRSGTGEPKGRETMREYLLDEAEKVYRVQEEHIAAMRAENERLLSEIESHKTTRRMWQERAEGLVAENEKLKATLRLFESYGCPACGGDCSSANPPVMGCPMQEARAALNEQEQG
jgi:hypothetical protein